MARIIRVLIVLAGIATLIYTVGAPNIMSN
jgi:hypothetical protein